MTNRRPVRRIRPRPTAGRSSFESLERRLALCAEHMMSAEPPVEERPDLVGLQGRASGDVNEPADIVWVNRANTTAGGSGDTDGFGARFGASAPAARAVVDAVIVAYERMIGSFNYPTAGATYNLNVNMGAANSGFGASASLATSLGGKPKTGSITMGAGNSSAGAGNGWFLDPTPYESSEFLGTITNAFAGNAQSGSPAFNKGDFYTVVAAELTHCMGLFGNFLPGWSSRTTGTTVTDTAEGGGTGQFWIFNGPSITHLLTSNNGGPGGQNFNSGIHSAGPINVTIGGTQYNGADDQGNAIYEFGRRYLVNNVFALMFKDAYGYSSVDPAKYGTFYSVLNESTGLVTVRGGTGGSSDNITITRTPTKFVVSVDIGNDVGGTGALPGQGNLPAFVTEYDISQVTGFSVLAMDGNDAVTLGADLGVTVSVSGSTGNDTLTLLGDAGDNAFTFSGASGSVGTTVFASLTSVETLVFSGNGGDDTLTISGTAAADTLTVGPTTITGTRVATYLDINTLVLNTAGGNDTITLNAPLADVVIDAGNDADRLTIGETAPGRGVRIAAGAAAAQLRVDVNLDATGSARFDVPESITIGTLNLDAGGLVEGAGDLTVTGATTFLGGAMAGAGRTIIPATGTLSLAGAADKTLARDLTLAGLAVWTDGDLLFSDDAILTNEGIFSASTATSLTARSLADSASAFENNDTFNAIGAGTITFDAAAGTLPFNNGNGATADLQAATVRWLGGGEHSGAILVAAASTLEHAGTHNYTLNGSLTGAGAVRFVGGESSLTTYVDVDLFDVASAAVVQSYGLIFAGTLEVAGVATLDGQTHVTGAGLVVRGTVDGVGGLFVESGGVLFDDGSIGGTGMFHVAGDLGFVVEGVGVKHLARPLTGGADLQVMDGVLAIAAGLSPSAPAMIVGNLTIATAAALDLADNTAVVDYAGPSLLASLADDVLNGYAGGAWTGAGIRSSTAAATPNRVVGYAEATQLFSSFPASFAGTTLEETSIVLRYTVAGDANLDRSVDFDDLLIVAQNYGSAGRAYAQGNLNFDGSGTVDFDDLLLLAQNYGTNMVISVPILARAEKPKAAGGRSSAAASILK